MSEVFRKNKYYLTPDCTLRKEEFGGLLFLKQTGRTLSLNGTGYKIASILAAREYLFGDIVETLQTEYGELLEPEIASIERLIQRLVSYGAVASGESANGDCVRINAKTHDTPSRVHSEVLTLSAPTMVWWDVTNACNLKCKQCYSSSHLRDPDELTTEEAIDVLNQLASIGVFFVYFLGGEPLMRKDFFTLLDRCRQLGLGVMISTNGWLVSSEKAERLVEAGVQHVRVSLDGAKSETHDGIRGVPGSHARAVEAVRNLKNAGMKIVGVGPTIMNDNFGEAEAIIDLAHALGANEIQLGMLCQIGRGKEIGTLSAEQSAQLRELYTRKHKELGHNIHISSPEGTWESKPYLGCVKHGALVPDTMGCTGGRTVGAISATGQVRCCLFYDFPVGDLRQSSFAEIWSGASNSNMRWLRSIKDGCKECTHSSRCSGPCPMQEISSSSERAYFAKRKCATDGVPPCPAS